MQDLASRREIAGVYPFYCDIDLHAVFGMKGRIEAR